MSLSNRQRSKYPKKHWVRAGLWFGLISFLIFGTEGCWSSRELNESALVAGAGFDRQGDKYLLTIQVLQPGKLTPKTRGHSERAVYISQDAGRTFFEAIRTFPQRTTRKLFWSHCQVFLVGREMANESVTRTLDWFYRNQEFRPLAYIAMADSDAALVLKAQTHLNPIPAFDLAADIETLSDTSQAPIVTLKDFMKMSAKPVGAAYMPILNQVRVEGTAVFLHDKLVGELNWDEGRGLLSLLGQVKSGKILIPSPAASGVSTQEFATLEIIQEHVNRQARFSHGQPVITYHIHCVADVADDPSLKRHTASELVKMEQAGAARIKGQAESCITKVKGWHTDVIGAGEVIHRGNPRQWQTLNQNWEQVFADTAIEVIVDIHIRHEGLIRGSK